MEEMLLIFGNEIDGVSQNLIDKCDISLEIPQYGTKHSEHFRNNRNSFMDL